MTCPKLSVLLPVYNGERFLREAIESILAQTMPDFEFIIVDDGSDDASWSIIQGFKDSRIRAYQRPHGGLDATLNFGLSVARAYLIARMDQDDVSLLDRLERQLKVVVEDEDVVVVGGQSILINEDGKHLGITMGPENHDDILRNILYGPGFGLGHPSVCMKADAMRKVGGYRARVGYADDVDIWLRLSEVGTLYSLPPPPILLCRKHSGGMSWHDEGRTQTLHGLAARVCYFKRKAGREDPAELDEGRWVEFIKEIEEVCVRCRIFRARSARQKISMHLQSVAGGRFLKARKMLRLVGLLVSEPKLAYGLTRNPWRKALQHLRRNI